MNDRHGTGGAAEGALPGWGPMGRRQGAGAVSVIVTVRDERASIYALLDSLALQRRAPDEIVVVDGGSRDGTLEALQARAGRGELPLVVLSRPGANISAGRNAAIAAASGPVIASTDAGVRLDDVWLAELVAPMERGARFVGGFFGSAPQTPFELALGAATLPEASEIDARRFLPSSRSVAFLKEDWARAGGYPEWLDYCEDLVFDFRLRAVAGPQAFAPAAMAWFRPRSNLTAFARQYYRYARGDGKAGLWPWRHAVRYAVYGAAAPALVWLAWARHPLWCLGLAAGAAWMLRRPYARLARQWRGYDVTQRALAVAWVPAIRVVGDLAKMLGYPAGVWWRVRHGAPAWRPAAADGRR